MPIYEFECDDTKKCGTKFQKLYSHRVSDDCIVLDDPDQENCPKCGEHATQLWSTVTMRPDRFWAGFYDSRLDKYWTSESRFNKHLKENDLVLIGDRSDREGLKKQAEEGMKSKDRKAEKDVEKAVIEELAWKDEFGDYGTVKQRNKKARERARLESECPADVCEDSAFK